MAEPSRRPAKTKKIAARKVETASGASCEAQGELLVLRDKKGAVVVVFDAEKGSAEVFAPTGDLTLAAPQGKVVLRAGTAVELHATERAEVRASEVALLAGKLDVRAQRILERAEEVYREIDGLLQVRAGRVRSLVKDVFQVLAKRARVVAEEDASLDGKRVLLG
jgi:hypothetical protein